MMKKSTKIKKEISNLLYEVDKYKGEDVEFNELMTITILKNKMPHLNFLTASTNWDATGYWKSKITDVSYDKEENAIVQIQYLDTKSDKVGKRLMELFEELNNIEIGEELLYIRTKKIDETTLPLKKWR
jgi:hypothetical protein